MFCNVLLGVKMKSIHKILIMGFIALFVLSSVSNAVAMPGDKVGMENKDGSMFITTPEVTLKLNEYKPDFFFRYTDNSVGRYDDLMFHLGFYYVAEIFGDDLIVDSRDEILGGKIYNLASPTIDWTIISENFTNELVATQTSSVLDNGATIQFVYHIYLEDQVVEQVLDENTTVYYPVKGLKEIKFDIIVSDWTFSPGAAGLVFDVKVHELRYRHRVQSGEQVSMPEEGIRINNTDEFTANRTMDRTRDGIGFLDGNRLDAYFAWTSEADIFDSEDNYVETVAVTATATSFGQDMNFGMGKEFGQEFINLQLAYPNYGDGMKLVHDPVLGVSDATGVSAGWYVLLAIPILAAGALVINRKRT